MGAILIGVRSVFRVIEYFEGFSGFLLSHDVSLYVFDALPMAVVMVLFNIFHPSEITVALKGGRWIKRLIFLEKMDSQPRNPV